MPLSLSIVIPAYFDEKTIALVVENTEVVLKKLVVEKYEIIIVEDGSLDSTAKTVDRLAQTHPNVRVIHHEKNQGYGTTLKDGFYAAQYEYVFYTDGDNQFNVADLLRFIPYVQTRDVVIGYRKVKQYSLFRKCISWIYNTIINLLFQKAYKDIDCAFKLFRRDLLNNMTLRSQAAFIDAELVLKCELQSAKVAQLPVQHLPRQHGKSTAASLSVGLRTIKEVVRGCWEIFQDKKI